MLWRCRAVACCSSTVLQCGAGRGRLPPVAAHRRAVSTQAPVPPPSLAGFDRLADSIVSNWLWDAINTCTLTKAFEAVAVYGHDVLGLPWWASVACLSVALRLCALPARIVAERVAARRVTIEHSVAARMHDLVDVHKAQRGWTDRHARRVTGALGRGVFLKEAKAQRSSVSHLRLFVLNTLPLPFWLCSYFAVRNLCSLRDATPAALGLASSFRPDMATGGCLWFGDLLHPEPLPVPVLSLLMFAMIYVQTTALASTNVLPPAAPIAMRMEWAVRRYSWMVIALLVVAISKYLPVCLPFYWLVSVSLTVTFNLCLQHPAVKRLFGIAPLPTDTRRPLRRALAKALLLPSRYVPK